MEIYCVNNKEIIQLLGEKAPMYKVAGWDVIMMRLFGQGRTFLKPLMQLLWAGDHVKV